jgi:hypothetical protein
MLADARLDAPRQVGRSLFEIEEEMAHASILRPLGLSMSLALFAGQGGPTPAAHTVTPPPPRPIVRDRTYSRAFWLN